MKKSLTILMMLISMLILTGCTEEVIQNENISSNSVLTQSNLLRADETTDLIELVSNDLKPHIILKRIINKKSNELMYIIRGDNYCEYTNYSTAIKTVKIEDYNKYLEKEYLSIVSDSTYKSDGYETEGIITLQDEYTKKKLIIYYYDDEVSMDMLDL